MKVLQIISSAGHYGAENMLVNLCLGLERLGCSTVLGVFFNEHLPNTEVAAKATGLGLAVEMIPCRGRADHNVPRRIRELVKMHGIDLIHTHGYKADIYGFLAARKQRVSILATCHNWPDKSLPLRAYTFLDHLVLRSFPHVVAVSETVKQSLRRFGIPERKISLIGNGIDCENFSAADPTLGRQLKKNGNLLVGMVARLVPAKGADDLLRAARGVLEKLPHCVFVFVGDGPMRHELETLARTLGIEENVVFSGQRGDMPGVYASLDLMVLPSLTEGMPMTILESLAARCPVVATRVGAIPEIVIPEQTGLLVDPGDVGGLRDAILRMLADAGLRRRFGEEGQRLVRQNFSSDAMARVYLNLYSELLGRQNVTLSREEQVDA